ncbi:hypothetical protein D3C85_1126070 [compost metagenome]
MGTLQIWNISMLNDIKLHCRVCGYRSESPPWGEDGLTPLFDFCPCCGVEHGYQDSTEFSARRYRVGWISAGAKWEEPHAKPEGWLLNEQLNCVPPGFK